MENVVVSAATLPPRPTKACSTCSASPSSNAFRDTRHGDETKVTRTGGHVRVAFIAAVAFFFVLSNLSTTSAASTPPSEHTRAELLLSEHLFDVDVAVTPDAETVSPALPRILEVKRKSKKCSHKYKHYCFNGGRCRWIKSLNMPSCRCVGDWKGKRCEIQDPFFTGKDKEAHKTNVIIAVVLSSFGLVGILTSFCVCWRRYKFVQNHKEETDVEIKQKCLRDSCRSDLLAVPIVVSVDKDESSHSRLNK